MSFVIDGISFCSGSAIVKFPSLQVETRFSRGRASDYQLFLIGGVSTRHQATLEKDANQSVFTWYSTWDSCDMLDQNRTTISMLLII